MRNRLSILVVICCLFTSVLFGQFIPMSAELATQLEGKKAFADIMATVDQYYVSKNYSESRSLTSEYKKWHRWAWYAGRHLNMAGEVDYNTDEYLEIALQRSKEPLGDQRSNSGIWSFVGPYNTVWAANWGTKGQGRADRLAFHPTNPEIIYAATPAGGLWRTDNGGLNWYSISSNLPNCGISGIVISADDPSGNKIFILTGDADTQNGYFVHNFGYRRASIGVLVSYNGGVTWSRCGNSQSAFNGRQCYKILQIRGLPYRMMVATDSGIYYTNDYGNTWNFQDMFGITIYDLEQHPTDNSIVYAALSNTIRKSVSWGVDFQDIASYNPIPGTAVRTALAVTPAMPDEVYFMMAGGVNRLYKSINSGDNFTSINTQDLVSGAFDEYVCAFAINPTTNLNMVTGGVDIVSSSNNGSFFGNLTTGQLSDNPPPANFIHSDIHDLAYNPLSNFLYAATDGGVYVSFDNGVNWTERTNGLTCTQYFYIDGVEGIANRYIGGAQDNGTAYTTNGSTMNYCGAGDGFAVSFVSDDDDLHYQVTNTDVYRFDRSTNTRMFISPGTVPNRTFYPNVIAHPTDDQIVYVGYANTTWRSSNQGGSWTDISDGMGTSNGGSGHTGGFAVTPATPDRLYAANATVLRRSDNQGDDWTTISGNPGWPGLFGAITDIACRPNTTNEVWITMTGNNGQNKVFYSSNAGASWTNFTGSLPDVPVYCIAYDDTGDAYIGTELGVYFMDFEMNDWVPFYNGMPLVPVTDLFINETLGQIQASTFGRGIWQSDLYSACGPFMFLTGLTEGQQFYQSNGFIETSQFVPGSFGNVLRLRSPAKIIFKNNFKIHEGGYMRATIGNCGQGIFNLDGNPTNTDNMTKANFLQLKATLK